MVAVDGLVEGGAAVTAEMRVSDTQQHERKARPYRIAPVSHRKVGSRRNKQSANFDFSKTSRHMQRCVLADKRAKSITQSGTLKNKLILDQRLDCTKGTLVPEVCCVDISLQGNQKSTHFNMSRLSRQV